MSRLDQNHARETWKAIWPTLNRRYPRTETYLAHNNEWELLVSVILSAQMTDEGVNAITPALFKKFPTAKKTAAAPMAAITEAVKSVNYYRVKAGYVKRTAELVMQNFGGKIPRDEASLRTLPGVGRKTAVVVLSHLGVGTDGAATSENVGIPVDTHVIRFAHRFGLSTSNNADQIERDLQAIIPQKFWKRAAYAMKDYGRKEGKARGYKPEADPLVQILQRKSTKKKS